MKTELAIAKENVNNLKNENCFYVVECARCVEHLSVCLRWLMVLKGYEEKHPFFGIFSCECEECDKLRLKKEDLKSVIKIYEEANLK